MDTKITEIEILLDKLNLLFNSVKSDGQLDKVEIELLKKYVNQLQDKLNAISHARKSDIPVTPVTQIISDPPANIPKVIVPDVKLKEEVPVIENSIPVEKTIVPEKEELKIHDTPVAEIKKEEIRTVVNEEKKPIHKLKEVASDELNKALNIKLSSNKKTLAERIHSSKAKEITSVIDLNDKLFFIKELFKGDANGYSAVLKKINAMGSIDEVKKYIQDDLTSQYNFSDKESVDRFLEVVKLKFE